MADAKTLRGNIDGWSLAAEIRMERQAHKGAFLIIEGSTDYKALGRFVNEDKCHFVVAFGKKNALEAIELLEDEGIPGVVALVDADFWHVEGTESPSENVVVTEHHDLDTVIFCSKALDVFLKERADGAKLKAVGGTDSVREVVFKATLPLGCARWLSQTQDFRVKFDLLKYSFLKAHDCSCDRAELLGEIVTASYRVDRDDFDRRLQALQQRDDLNPRQICNGHDLTRALGCALSNLIGNLRSSQIWASEVAAGLRLAFDNAAFKATSLYVALRHWEQENPGYTLLEVA